MDKIVAHMIFFFYIQFSEYKLELVCLAFSVSRNKKIYIAKKTTFILILKKSYKIKQASCCSLKMEIKFTSATIFWISQLAVFKEMAIKKYKQNSEWPSHFNVWQTISLQLILNINISPKYIILQLVCGYIIYCSEVQYL